jgi:hypothetical protein
VKKFLPQLVAVQYLYAIVASSFCLFINHN